MKKRIPYGVANYKTLVTEYGYYIDKTEYIRLLEDYQSPVFLRPRRFGKSLLCQTLGYYYDHQYADEFESLFGHTAIGRNPTPSHNSYVVLPLNFSTVPISKEIQQLEQNFNDIINSRLMTAFERYEALESRSFSFDPNRSCTSNLAHLLDRISGHQLPSLYVTIDEYDNFANQFITARNDPLYDALTDDDGFLKSFFKLLKDAVTQRTVAHCFITGVLPITMDELASGYNIADFLTLNPRFEEMLGFTQSEVDRLLDEIYSDHDLDPQTRPEVETLLQTHYNGYRFSRNEGPKLYNSTILFYFLRQLCEHRVIPEHLTDANLKTDIKWIQRLTGSNPQLTKTFVDQVLWKKGIHYDRVQLTEKFDMHRFFEPEFFPLSFFYLGMLTRQDPFTMKLPNLNMRMIFTEYFNEIHHLNDTSGYAQMMIHFLETQDFEQLFTDYWKLYIALLPEAVFASVNENFYRTTFYDLCRRYLSEFYVFHIERSSPAGRSDLEFVGKPQTKYAGQRILVEFKYWSNAKLSQAGKTVETFAPIEKDVEQVRGYEAALQQEIPEAKITSYLVYCLGNQGFRFVALSGFFKLFNLSSADSA